MMVRDRERKGVKKQETDSLFFRICVHNMGARKERVAERMSGRRRQSVRSSRKSKQ